MGDKNIALFHRYATTRKRFNSITKLECVDGSFMHNDRDLEELATGFFQKLFTSDGVNDFTHILSGIDTSILDDMNQILLTDFTKEDVWNALKSMGPMKTPGFDSFPTIFYQRY